MSSHTGPPPKFIVLKADMTGDIWHVAATCALWDLCHDKVEADPPIASVLFPHWKPRPAIIVWEGMGGGDAKSGERAFVYLKDISTAPVVVMISAADEKYLDTLSHTYISRVAEESDKAGPDSWNDALGLAETQLRRDNPNPLKGTNGPRFDKNLIPLVATTAMVMQMMDFVGVPKALDGLGSKMSAGLDDDVKQKFERFLLLNYRIGKVNTQHDTNETIKDSLKKTAAGEMPPALVISIPQMREVLVGMLLRDLDWQNGKISGWMRMESAPSDNAEMAKQAIPAVNSEERFGIMLANLRDGLRLPDTTENFRDRIERRELGIVATNLDVLLAGLEGATASFSSAADPVS
ncbi:hypothetical protein LTR37_009349 [Vermiconidia calcicola]|uniref:Uncharacterized protein n=1 Tax=Vermiconidia calcicola TaxID=1690605 RepID=A0ACC3N862_9PEZI|nr:hypothetical protein LTR37_009349 [Vermiconidia calcicola]